MRLAAFLLCATLSVPAVADDLVVKVGHVGSLSGPIAHLGKDVENGARLAVEELNARNLQIGGKRARFELLSEDDGADPKQATTAAQKLVDAHANVVIGHTTSGTTLPASKIYADAGIPHIVPSSTLPKLTRQGYRTLFRLIADDSRLGAITGGFMLETLKAKRVAVIDDRTAYGQGLGDEITRAIKASGGKADVVAREFTNDKANDFKAILTRIKGKSPDVIFFGGMDAVGGPMLRQMRQIGLHAKFVGGDGICTEAFARLAGAEVVGNDQVYCGIPGGTDGNAGGAAYDAFVARYKARFNVPMEGYSNYAYAAVLLAADAMVRAGSAEPAKYLPALVASDYKGVTGRIRFDVKGDLREGALDFNTYRGGKQVTLGVMR